LISHHSTSHHSTLLGNHHSYKIKLQIADWVIN
jgi:hypothetical protein